MTCTRRHLWIALAAAVVALGVAFAGWLSHRFTSEGWARTQADLLESERLVQEIRRYRDRPAQVRREGMPPATLIRLLEDAAKNSGLNRMQLDRVWPQPPQRLNDPAYARHATQLILREVTLHDAVQFLHRVVRSAESLHADGLRLTTPAAARSSPGSSVGSRDRASNPAETWNLEVTLSYLVYTGSNETPRTN